MASFTSFSSQTQHDLIIPQNVDEHEYMMNKHGGDGFPVVIPTPERVKLMMSYSSSNQNHRNPNEIIGKCPPSHNIVTIENIAIAAVMAGCHPKHFGIVVAAVEASLTSTFNYHGNHATTMGCTPCIIVSGPGSSEAGINHGVGCLGSGTRANATIGRALKLVLYNIGGARLGGSESSTHGSPSKYSFCFGENITALESLGGWKPYHTDLPITPITTTSTTSAAEGIPEEVNGKNVNERNMFNADDTVVTVMPTVGFNNIVDFYMRDPYELVDWMADSIVHSGYNSGFAVLSSGLLVLSPEHYELLSREFKTRESFQKCLWERCNALLTPQVGSIIARAKFGESSAFTQCLVKAAFGAVATSMRIIGKPQTLTPKFFSPESLHVVVAGAEAGKFSCFCPGFGVGFKGMPTAFMSMPAHAKVSISPPPSNATTPTPTPMSSNELKSKGTVYYSPDYVVGSDAGDGGGSSVLKKEMSLAPRLSGHGDAPTLESPDAVIGLLDISKGGSSVFLKQLAKHFDRHYPSAKVLVFQKPTFNRPAPQELRQQIASQCSHVVVALAD